MSDLRPRAAVTWRYLPTRTVKHALADPSDARALCGIAPAGWFPDAADWRGTGSQTEYEQVERLPECRRCASRLGPPPDLMAALRASLSAAKAAQHPTDLTSGSAAPPGSADRESPAHPSR